MGPLIVPGLGVVILLATFVLGVPLVYQLFLGILGLAAAGTYFAPHRVQVETRILISAMGLIILLIVTSTAFWLTLLSFGAIAALQIQHRGTLQRSPATIAWLRTVVKAAQERRSGRPGSGAADAGAMARAGSGESQLRAASGLVALPAFLRVNVAGIGGLVAGVVVLISVFLPWVNVLASAYGEMAADAHLTLRAAARELDLPALSAFFFVLVVLGVLSVLSIGLPRAVAGIIASAGLVVTLASYFYVFFEVESEATELSSIGVGVTALPAVGSMIAGLVFVAMSVLQIVPSLNQSRSKE